MSNILWKNFHFCFSKFKCLPTTLSPPPTNDDDDDDDDDEDYDFTPDNPNNSSTLVKNFNSIYDVTSGSISKSLTSSTEDFFSSDHDSDDSDSIPDFSTVFASRRFFFSSPGNSNSIIESPERPTECSGTGGVVSGSVAIQTYSPDPFVDFRRSMQEMVEAHELTNGKADWDFLHELLLSYLTLNSKHAHKVIIGAFTDLIVSLMSSTTTNHRHRKTHNHRRCTTSRLLV